jgi:GxxExxY protein
MPIVCEQHVPVLTQDEFHAIDYEVMEQVFSVHNDLGRFHDEAIYQREILWRCKQMGFESVGAEIPIHVSYDDFRKTYFVDLVVCGALYELKAARTISGRHKKQALNYLFLLGLHHGKVVNMRPESVESAFVSTRLTHQRRRDFQLVDEHWNARDEHAIWLKELVLSLLVEWGGFLDIELFCDAVCHFRGEGGQGYQAIEVVSGSRVIGTQKTHLLSSTIGLKFSAISTDPKHYGRHLHRFLNHSKLEAIHWVNLNRQRVEFRTIRR